MNESVALDCERYVCKHGGTPGQDKRHSDVFLFIFLYSLILWRFLNNKNNENNHNRPYYYMRKVVGDYSRLVFYVIAYFRDVEWKKN